MATKSTGTGTTSKRASPSNAAKGGMGYDNDADDRPMRGGGTKKKAPAKGAAKKGGGTAKKK